MQGHQADFPYNHPMRKVECSTALLESKRKSKSDTYWIIFNFINQNTCCRILRLQSLLDELVVISFGLERHRVSLNVSDGPCQLVCIVSDDGLIRKQQVADDDLETSLRINPCYVGW